jgi:uncharacterized membrane protein YfcA
MTPFELFTIGGLLSILSSLLSGFAGGGGSLVLLSMLLLIFPDSPYLMILAATKVNSALVTATSGLVHYEKQKLNWTLIAIATLTGLLGVALSTYLLQHKIDDAWIITLVPLLLILTGLYLLIKKDIGVNISKEREFNSKTYTEMGIFSFFLSGLNGMIGGLGLLAIPYYVIRLRIPYIKAVAYGMLIGIVIHTLQSGYLIWTEGVDLPLMIGIVFGSMLGAWLGTELQYLKGNRFVKLVSVTVMFGVALQMLLT